MSDEQMFPGAEAPLYTEGAKPDFLAKEPPLFKGLATHAIALQPGPYYVLKPTRPLTEQARARVRESLKEAGRPINFILLDQDLELQMAAGPEPAIAIDRVEVPAGPKLKPYVIIARDSHGTASVGFSFSQALWHWEDTPDTTGIEVLFQHTTPRDNPGEVYDLPHLLSRPMIDDELTEHLGKIARAHVSPGQVLLDGDQLMLEELPGEGRRTFTVAQIKRWAAGSVSLEDLQAFYVPTRPRVWLNPEAMDIIEEEYFK